MQHDFGHTYQVCTGIHPHLSPRFSHREGLNIITFLKQDHPDQTLSFKYHFPFTLRQHSLKKGLILGSKAQRAGSKDGLVDTGACG